jgi:hypothetical protein
LFVAPVFFSQGVDGLLSEDELKRGEALETVQERLFASPLESLRCVALGVLENLQTLVVGLSGRLLPEIPDEAGGRRAQDRCVFGNEPLGPERILLGKAAFPWTADTARWARDSRFSAG